MDSTVFKSPHLRLTFNEAMILMENLDYQDKASFIATLTDLIQNTTDPFLLRELQSLNEKILELSEAEFQNLRTAVEERKILFPANFTLA